MSERRARIARGRTPSVYSDKICTMKESDTPTRFEELIVWIILIVVVITTVLLVLHRNGFEFISEPTDVWVERIEDPNAFVEYRNGVYRVIVHTSESHMTTYQFDVDEKTGRVEISETQKEFDSRAGSSEYYSSRKVIYDHSNKIYNALQQESGQ